MDAMLKLPMDLPNHPAFRELRSVLGGSPARALWAWFVLWQELRYRMQEPSAIAGRLPQDALSSLTEAMAPELNAEETSKAIEVWLRHKVLIVEGDLYVCLRFGLMHGADLVGNVNQASLGGHLRSFHARQRAAEGSALLDLVQMDPAKLVGADGQPLDADRQRRCRRLIIGLDNALKKSERPLPLYTATLFAQADSQLQGLSDDEVSRMLRMLAVEYAKGHPALRGMVTEKLLPRFRELCGVLAQH